MSPKKKVKRHKTSPRRNPTDYVPPQVIKYQITPELLQSFRQNFYSNEKNCLAQNIISKTDPNEACLRRAAIESTSHVFSYRVKQDDPKPITNQKGSGRCWAFACLNAMRIPFIQRFHLDDFEFSQSYIFYVDKIERCNYFLNNIVEVGKREPREQVSGRLLSFLLNAPISDGGQWDMIVNLVEKYGVIPKKCFPETYSCECSSKMNHILNSTLRQYARDLLDLIDDGAIDEEIQSAIRNQMLVIYRIVGICLSIPPETFTWEYYDRTRTCKKIGPTTPIDFYNNHVKPTFDISSRVCLVSDPREENIINRTYTVDCLGNVVGGRPVIYNNQSIDTLIEVTANSLKSGVPVWFGCDVNKQFSNRKGILDISAYDHELVFGTRASLGMSKAERLRFGDSAMSHAMIFTGVDFDEYSRPVKWRIENSWGKEHHEDGHITMTTDWFREFVFEIVASKKFVPSSILNVFEYEPIVLPAWDPMGILANNVN